MMKPSLNYKKIGNGNRVVVLIHGYGASSESFSDIIPLFDESYQLWLIDLIGFGNSKFVKGWDYTFESQTELVYRFLEENDLKDVTLIGHSYGGGVSLLLLLMAQEKNNYQLIKNAILITPACYRQKVPFFIRVAGNRLLFKLITMLNKPQKLAERSLESLYVDPSNITDSKIAKYTGYFTKKDNINAMIETSKNIIPESINSLEKNIRNIKSKVLILAGTKDFITPLENMRRLNRDIKHSRLIELKGSGHMFLEEKPEETFKYIDDFIKKHKTIHLSS